MKYMVTLFVASLLIVNLAHADRYGGYASRAVANANSKAYQNQGQDQTTAVNIGGTHFKHNAPGGYAPGAMFPTAPCQATMGAGFSFLLGGGAAAGSRTLDQCELRETIRTVIHMESAGIRMKDTAIALLCMTEHGAKTPLCQARQPEVVVEVVPDTRLVKFEDMFK